MYQEEKVQIDGVQTRIFTGGQGEPLVWLNGAGQAEESPFFEELARNYNVYLVESPGFGESEKIEWITEAADYNYFYRDFLDHFGLEKVNLGGHSIGGRIALEFAISHPHRVNKLVLLAAQGAYVEGVKVADYFLGGIEKKAKYIWHDETYQKQMMSQELSKEESIRAEKNDAALARLIWEKNFNPKFPTLLKYVTSPTCLIWGQEDQLSPVEHGEYFNRYIKDSELHTIADSGHMTYIEKHAECSNLITGFLGQ